MASHIYHPPIAEAGLCVECARCAEIAERPTVHLDRTNLHAYWQKMLAVMVHEQGGMGLTDLDMDTINYLYRVYVDLERLKGARAL